MSMVVSKKLVPNHSTVMTYLTILSQIVVHFCEEGPSIKKEISRPRHL